MPWFYNSHSGEAAEESGPAAVAYEAALHLGIGWHEYTTQQDMLAAIQANGWPAPTGVAGGVANLGTQAASGAASGIGNALGLPSVNGAALRPLMVRVMKVIAGLLLVAVGVVQLAHPEKALAAVRGVIA
jgi:hypothetical protein